MESPPPSLQSWLVAWIDVWGIYWGAWWPVGRSCLPPSWSWTSDSCIVCLMVGVWRVCIVDMYCPWWSWVFFIELWFGKCLAARGKLPRRCTVNSWSHAGEPSCPVLYSYFTRMWGHSHSYTCRSCWEFWLASQISLVFSNSTASVGTSWWSPPESHQCTVVCAAPLCFLGQ